MPVLLASGAADAAASGSLGAAGLPQRSRAPGRSLCLRRGAADGTCAAGQPKRLSFGDLLLLSYATPAGFRAPLTLPRLAASGLLARPGAAARAAAAAAAAEALLAAPALLGSLELLGNLTGLAAGLAAGAADLLGLPLAGLAARSPSQASLATTTRTKTCHLKTSCRKHQCFALIGLHH